MHAEEEEVDALEGGPEERLLLIRAGVFSMFCGKQFNQSIHIQSEGSSSGAPGLPSAVCRLDPGHRD